MKKILLAGVTALAALAASPAAAENINETLVFGNTTAAFDIEHVQNGSFTDELTFTLGGDFLINSSVISIAISEGVQDVDFTSITLQDAMDNVLGTFTGTSDGLEVFSLPLTSLTAGTYSIVLAGTVTGAPASYGGNVNITSAVPEPATWAMMLVGFGAVGYSMRSRKAGYRLAQAI